jgi:hypothetical protein
MEIVDVNLIHFQRCKTGGRSGENVFPRRCFGSKEAAGGFGNDFEFVWKAKRAEVFLILLRSISRPCLKEKPGELGEGRGNYVEGGCVYGVDAVLAEDVDNLLLELGGRRGELPISSSVDN